MKINKRQLRKLIMEFVSLNENPNTNLDKKRNEVKEKLKKKAGKSFLWGASVDGKKAASLDVRSDAGGVIFYDKYGEYITTKTVSNDFAYLDSVANYIASSYVMEIDGKAFRKNQKQERKKSNKKGMDAVNAILTGPSGEEVFGAEMAKYNKKKAEEELKKAEAEAKKAAKIAEKRQELSDLYVGDPKQEEVLIAYDKHISKGVKPEVAAYRAKKYGLVSPNIDKEVADEKKAAAAEKKKKIRSRHFNTKTPSGNRLGSTIKNKATGNKFREWVNKNYPELAKAKRNQMITVSMPDGKNYEVPGLDLDPAGSYTNSYIRKAWKLLGDAYLKPSKPSIDNANIQKAFQNLGQEIEGSTPEMKMGPDGKLKTVKESLSRGSLYRQRYRRY